MRRARVIAAVACVVLAGLIPAMNVVPQLAETQAWTHPRDDDVSIFERRFTALRAALRGQPAVGYLAPQQLQPAARRAHLFLTRYTLAPTQVRNRLDEQLVVADLMADRAALPPHLSVRQNFGGGLLLLERAEQ